MKSQEHQLQWSEVILVFAVISFGVALRLTQIQQPFVDAWSWRQADVGMIAENFYRHGFNIFYPQINWAGQQPGYVGTEFQLVAFIAAVVYLAFGVQEWIGRLVSVAFFAVSVPFLYLLARKVSNPRSGAFAIGIYTLAPLSIFAGRSFMPDMAALSLSIIALYLFSEWLEMEKNLGLFVALCLATALAILTKLPAIIIGVPFLYMSWTKHGARFLLQRKLWLYATCSLIPPVAWYLHAYLVSTAQFPHHMFGSGLIGIVEPSKYIDIILNTATSNLTPLVFALMIAGIVLPTQNQYGGLFHWWLLGIAIFVVFVGEGNLRHIWYQLPVTAVGSVFAGMALDFLAQCIQKYRRKVLTVFAIGSFFAVTAYHSFYYVTPFYIPWALPSLKAGNAIDRLASPEALVIVPGSGDPTTIYHSKRKGWHFLGDGRIGSYPATSELAIADVENLRHNGAGFLVLTKDTVWYLDRYKGLETHLNQYYRSISDGQDYLIFDLRMKRTETP